MLIAISENPGMPILEVFLKSLADLAIESLHVGRTQTLAVGGIGDKYSAVAFILIPVLHRSAHERDI